MPVIIMDPCHFTQSGLLSYMADRGIDRDNIVLTSDVSALQSDCQHHQPGAVFINEACFIDLPEASKHVKCTITQHPDTLFFLFMSLSTIQFAEYLHIRNNVIITSKSIQPVTLDRLLNSYFHQTINTDLCCHDAKGARPLTLSRTESNMLKMWMSGNNTSEISSKMQITIKTVSSHKGNIKRKIKTHNMQVIHHVVRLTDNVTSGIFINAGVNH